MTSLSDSIQSEIQDLEWRHRFDIREHTVFPGDILKSEVIVFNRRSILQIGSKNSRFVAIIAREIHFHSSDATSTILVSVSSGQDGVDGSNGGQGVPGIPDGQDGEDGGNGRNGSDCPNCFIYAEKITFGEENGEDFPPLVVVANGGNGGSGGNGGAGGNGANGNNFFRGEQTVNGIIQ